MKHIKKLKEITPDPVRCEFHYPQSDGSVRVERVDPNEVFALLVEVELLADNAKPLVDAAEKDRDYWMDKTKRLREAVDMRKSSFYCDGETPEKAYFKELLFNHFVEMVQALD